MASAKLEALKRSRDLLVEKMEGRLISQLELARLAMEEYEAYAALLKRGEMEKAEECLGEARRLRRWALNEDE